MAKLNIAILEDHPIIIDSIKNQLDSHFYQISDFTERDLLKKAIQHIHFDLIISDIRLKNQSNAFSLFEEIRDKITKTPLIVYSTYSSPWIFIRFARLGITPKAYIDKTELPDWDMVIHNVLKNQKQYSINAANSMHIVNNDSEIIEIINFSDRKWEMLQEFLKGKSDKEIAETNNISQFTVNDYRKLFYKTFNVKNIPSLMTIFKNLGFYDIG